jgi:hypothetical protein
MVKQITSKVGCYIQIPYWPKRGVVIFKRSRLFKHKFLPGEGTKVCMICFGVIPVGGE